MSKMYLLILVVMGGAVVQGAAPQEYGGTTHTAPYKDSSTPYGFSYTVQDPNSGVDLGHSEESDGGTVQGQYTVLLPDGRRQTVHYQADHHRGFQPTIGYEIEGDRNYLGSTNDHIKFQYLKNVENIRRTFPANQEIIVDQILPQIIDENAHKYYRNDKSFVSNNNVYTLQSHISKPISQLNYTNEKKLIIGTHEEKAKNESKIQMENSNMNTYNDSNIYFVNGNENKLTFLNTNASNSVRTLKSISQTHQYEPSVIEESNIPFNTNKSTKEEEHHVEHKKTTKEVKEEYEFPIENNNFMKDSKDEKTHVDAQLFKGDYEVTVKINENLRNYETSELFSNNNQVIRNIDVDDNLPLVYHASGQSSEHIRSNSTTIKPNSRKKDNLGMEKKEVTENIDLANFKFETEKMEKIDNVNLTNSIWQLSKDHSNNNINNSEQKKITSDIANSRKQVQLTNYNKEINVKYSPFNDHNIPDSELDAYLAMAIGEGFGSKVSSISSDILTQEYNENYPIVHGDLVTREENDAHLPNENIFIPTPMNIETHLNENENENKSEKMKKYPLSIYSDQVQFNKKNTEANIIASELYLNDNYKDDEISEIPHDNVPSQIGNEYTSIINENYENDNLLNNHKLTYTEVNSYIGNEYHPNIYTMNNSDNIFKDITQSGGSIVDEPIKNSDNTPVYDSDIIYEYQFDDDYENYDSFINQPEYHNEEEIETLPNSKEKIQKTNVYLPLVEFAISNNESFSINSTEGVQADRIEKELSVSNLSDKNILEKNYLPDMESFISRPTLVKGLFINQTSENYVTNNNSLNDDQIFNNKPKIREDDILESPSFYNIDHASDYLYDETTEIYEPDYYPIIEQNFNVTDYEFEDTQGNTYEISTIQNTKQDINKDSEHSQMKNILSENNIYDYVSINPIEYLTFPAEKFSEIVAEIEPIFQTHQPNIVIIQTNQPDTVDIKTGLSVTVEEGSKKYENTLEIPSEYQTVPKRKFTRLNKESILRQLPERFKQFSIPSAIGVMSDHGSHPHRPTKNFVTKQNYNDDIITANP